MANLYSQNLTLKDIFNAQELKNVVPLVNYKEIVQDSGKISKRTNMKTVTALVFETAKSSARPYYSRFRSQKSGDFIEVGGELNAEHDVVVNAVYEAIKAQKPIMVWTANNMDMIRSALKESENNNRTYSINSKLYLKTQSVLDIKGMSKQRLQALRQEIMENIIFGDDFPKTQKKFNIVDMFGKFGYLEQKNKWKRKVGIL